MTPHCPPAQRGAALALYALSGFTTGFLGPVAVGIVLDWFGGAVSVSGWRAGYFIIAIGSAVAAWAVWRAPESKSNIRVERGPDSRQLGSG